jgi:hypothetical protein
VNIGPIPQRAQQRGYGLVLMMLFLATTVMVMFSLQMTTQVPVGQVMISAMNNVTAESLARTGLQQARTKIFTDLTDGTLDPSQDSGATSPANWTYTSPVSVPSDPSNLASAGKQVGSFTATITRWGVDGWFVVQSVGTANGASVTVSDLMLVTATPSPPSPPINGVRFLGRLAGDLSGYSVSSAGDVDGDGIDDLLIGCFGADGDNATSDNRGETYLVFGRTLANWGTLADASAKVDLLAAINGVDTGDNNMIRFIGRATGDRTGYSVSSAGDVDGDGIDDLLIGASWADGGGDSSGEAYLVFGRSKANWNAITDASGNVNLIDINGVDAGDNNMIRFIGRAASDSLAPRLSPAGDVDGDGKADLLIGAYTADGGNASTDNRGETYLIFGRPRNELIDDDPDFDNSGIDWHELTDASGNVNLSTAINGVDAGDNNMIRFVGRAAQDYSGWIASSAGDVNNDGFDDIVIGAIQLSSKGEVYLIFGRSLANWNAITDASGNVNLLTAINGVDTGDNNMIRFVGRLAGDYNGYSLSSAGDVDGDGIDDLLIGAAEADGGGTNKGEVYLIFGRSLANWNAITDASGNVNLTAINGVNTGDNNMIRFVGRTTSERYGYSVSSAGDVDGDGKADLVTSAYMADGGNGSIDNRGETYLIFGRSLANWNTLTDASGNVILTAINGVDAGDNNMIRIIGRTAGENSGNLVSSVGDMDGDGKADLLIGAYQADGGNGSTDNRGETYLIFGKSLSDWNTLTNAAGDISLLTLFP